MVDLAPILEIMDDQAFVALRLKADRDILLWPDLEADALPKNCTKEETWKLVTAVRKQTASVLPWHSYLDIGYEAPAWYSVTRSMSLALADIDKRYANGS